MIAAANEKGEDRIKQLRNCLSDYGKERRSSLTCSACELGRATGDGTERQRGCNNQQEWVLVLRLYTEQNRVVRDRHQKEETPKKWTNLPIKSRSAKLVKTHVLFRGGAASRVTSARRIYRRTAACIAPGNIVDEAEMRGLVTRRRRDLSSACGRLIAL